MRIKLQKIKLENFKCFKSKEIDFDGNNATVRAENKRGKTTLKDAINWLLFGKLSDGRSTGYRPIVTDPDSPDYMKPIKGLVVKVEAELLLNRNVIRTLRKEEHEVVAKNQDVKYTSKFWIDGVPQATKRDYDDFIANTIPVDKFKMLTDLDYFNDDKKNPWEQRRVTLRDIAGAVSEPQGEWHDKFRAKLAGKTIKEYEKMLKGRINKYKDEQVTIPILLTEKNKDLAKYAQTESTKEAEEQRDNCKEKKAGLEAERLVLRNSETERNGHVEHINRLTMKRSHRESVVKNQAGPVDDLLAERAELERKHADKTQDLVEIQGVIGLTNATIESVQNQIESSQLTLQSVKKEYNSADSPNCSLCGQAWPEDKPRPGLADIEARGKSIKSLIDRTVAKKAELQEALNKLFTEEKAKVEELKKAESIKNKRIAEINEAIKNIPEPDPAQDKEWRGLTAEIEAAQAKLGDPLTEQLEAIEAKIKTTNEELVKLNECLAQADTIKQTKDRIAELEARQPVIGQDITKAEGLLNEVKTYKAAQNSLIEGAVNDLFEHVTYRLFYYHQNGEYESCCIAIDDGVPYSSMSDGQKMSCNIDVRNTLSDYYGVEVPLFIDHSESMTLPIEAKSQVIKLCAKKGVKELQVEVEQKAEVA